MDEPQLPAPRASSRTLVIVVVAVLIVIAVAGIMIAALRGKAQAPGALSTAPAASAASASRSTPGGGDPNHIDFSAGSDQLSPADLDQVKIMAESTKNATSLVVLTGKIEATSDRAARMDLTKKRVNAFRRALQAKGISPTRFRVEIAEYPVGRVPARETDRIEMILR